ncbi:MAG: hypothetical protein C4533_07035 [Candidatus Omnitrophota bacterium]|jgi:type IV pilus assembly protein PilQ|nr:MAG: hypothetical protein C4533_07035 [Candidatus Omnitrophota bacterium]
MKNDKIRFSFLIAVMLMLMPAVDSRANMDALYMGVDKTISMDFQDASLKDVIKVFAIQSGLNFVASETVQDRRITLYFDKVPLKEAMDKIFKANSLSYDLDKDSNVFVVKDYGMPRIETETKVFYLKYATVSSSSLKEEMSNNLTGDKQSSELESDSGSGGTEEKGKWKIEEDSGITQIIKKMLSEYGSVVEDYRTNSLIVTDIPSKMPIITKAIAALDIPAPQVMLEVEMLDVSKNSVDKLGFKYGQSPFTAILTGATRYTTFPFSSWVGGDHNEGTTNPAGTIATGNIAINTGNNTYSIIMDFLKTQTDTKYLARPRILTLNNETAEIKISTNETIGVTVQTSTTEGTAQTSQGVPERTLTGVTLRVTPQVNLETGEITMFVLPSVKDTSTSTFTIQGSSTQFFRDPEERSTKSVVRVKDGDTVVLGGLIRNQTTEVVTKVPILGDVPVLGTLFRHKSKDPGKQRELLVFITPRIVKEDNKIELAQVANVNTPDREQSFFTVADRQSNITSVLDKFDTKKK